MRYAPLADTRLVAAVFVCRPYAAKPIVVRGCQGCAKRTTGAERKEPGLDAGAHSDYLAWPSKDGKPQRPAAGQGSGSRAAPTREVSLAMRSLPRRPDPRHTARPVQDRSTYLGSAATHEGCGGTLPPRCTPAHAHAASASTEAPSTPSYPCRQASPRWSSCWCAQRGLPLTQEPCGITLRSISRREER
jgi:hypothetical protein